LVSIILGPILFYSTNDGLTVAARHVHELPIDFFMIVTIPIPLVISLGVLFAGIWVSFVICFIFAWLSRAGFITSVRDLLTKTGTMAKANFLIVMPLVASGLLYATILITQFQETQGVQTGSLNFPPATSPYLILLELAFAPLREEFGFRITSIGIPLAIFLAFRYRSDPNVSGWKNTLKFLLLTMLSPEWAKSKVGYRNVKANGFLRGISPLEWILILITAFAFGSAHFLLGGGWEIGKVTTAFLAGLLFGIMYVSYGAYANILLHWFFNYYFTVLDMADTAYGGAFHAFANISETVTLATGVVIVVVFLLYTAVRIGNSLVERVATTARRNL
jgi:hypothetical protein